MLGGMSKAPNAIPGAVLPVPETGLLAAAIAAQVSLETLPESDGTAVLSVGAPGLFGGTPVLSVRTPVLSGGTPPVVSIGTPPVLSTGAPAVSGGVRVVLSVVSVIGTWGGASWSDELQELAMKTDTPSPRARK